MRARGAMCTDVAILVVAADDGIMPQTIEAINHAKAAKIPIIVAVNKMDKPGANPDRVLTQLTEHDLVPAEWGGDTEVCRISAKMGMGIDELLETVILTAELQDLRPTPTAPPRARSSRPVWTRPVAPSPPCWFKTAPCIRATSSLPAPPWATSAS